MDKIIALIEQVRATKKAYDAQYQKMWSTGTDGQYNARYAKKAKALWQEWKLAEAELLKGIF